MEVGEYYELRAKPFDSDKWIYGEIYDAGYGFFINRTEIDPQTVQRLAGYDEEGNEVYKILQFCYRLDARFINKKTATVLKSQTFFNYIVKGIFHNLRGCLF